MEVMRTIDRIQGQAGTGVGSTQRIEGQLPEQAASQTTGGTSFSDELAAAARERTLQLSGHAAKRLEQRQIDLGSDQLDRLQRAMDTLAAKGGRQSLVMLDNVAYVVNVPSNTVVTAVAPEDGKESVFTKIDSVVIA